jgi:hypothetical protein
MDYSWSKQRLATVGSAVFTKPVIQGSDPISHTTHLIFDYITFLLNNQKNITRFGELVSLINVKYIIIDKTSLAPKEPYQFLYKQADLELVRDSDLVVFKNKAKTAKIYQTDGLLTVKDWNELLTIDLVQEKIPVDYNKEHPNEYILKENPTRQHIVFTSTYSEDWRYDGQKPLNYLGLTNAFNTTKARRIYWSKFRYYSIGYILSGLTFIGIIVEYSRHQ